MANGRSGSNVLQTIARPFEEIYSNIEKGHQRAAADIGLMAKGNFNNAAQSLIKGPMLVSGMNVDDVNDMPGGDLGSVRAEKKGTQDQKDSDARDAVMIADEKKRQVASGIAGIIDAQKRSPGRSQTLIGGGSGRNTLLTLIGTK